MHQSQIVTAIKVCTKFYGESKEMRLWFWALRTMFYKELMTVLMYQKANRDNQIIEYHYSLNKFDEVMGES